MPKFGNLIKLSESSAAVFLNLYCLVTTSLTLLLFIGALLAQPQKNFASLTGRFFLFPMLTFLNRMLP